MPEDEQDLTPPHGDDLRSEETFGRTDRYSNMDDDDAERTEKPELEGSENSKGSKNK